MSVSGETLATEILNLMTNLGLDMEKCVGQAYDGASNMSGRVNGTAALITSQHPQATYSHCKSHLLNLALMKSCSSIQPISKYCISCILHRLTLTFVSPKLLCSLTGAAGTYF